MSSVKATGRGAATLCPVCAPMRVLWELFITQSVHQPNSLSKYENGSRDCYTSEGKINPGCGAEDDIVVAASGSPVGRSAPVPVLSQSPGGSHCRRVPGSTGHIPTHTEGTEFHHEANERVRGSSWDVSHLVFNLTALSQTHVLSF